MYCQKCGSQISDNSVFCEKCGSRVAMNPERPAEEPPRIVVAADEPAPQTQQAADTVQQPNRFLCALLVAAAATLLDYALANVVWNLIYKAGVPLRSVMLITRTLTGAVCLFVSAAVCGKLIKQAVSIKKLLLAAGLAGCASFALYSMLHLNVTGYLSIVIRFSLFFALSTWVFPPVRKFKAKDSGNSLAGQGRTIGMMLMIISVVGDLISMFAIGFDSFIPITIGATVIFVVGFLMRMFCP